MITDHTFRLPGLYVEGRYFRHEYDAAESFAFALACEYMRPIQVWHNTPSEPVPTRAVFTAQPERIAA